MASEDRVSAPAVADPLLSQARDYAFFQALRLLRMRFSDKKAFADSVRVRPRLGLGFPQRDIENIELDEQGRYRLEANFFGLYGVTSPLPTFYTEDLIDEQQQGHSAGRDFIDILHASLYPLLFRAWEKHRVWISINERGELNSLRHLQALIGVADARPGVRDDSLELLRFAGLFNQYPRSALGLQQLMRSALDGDPVEVVPCVETRLRIDRPARTYLGMQCGVLGENSLLGREMLDRSGTLDIRVGPVSAARFNQLLPGQAMYGRLEKLGHLYMQTPLRLRLVVSLDRQEQHGATLGNGWQSLGLDTWLGDRTVQDDVVFMLTAANGSTPEVRMLQ
ncbi:type VI secretion system baseplate subunit TssG [Pseudomonas sp. DSP3-2-2]|uniref:type VI secretion system baseplate subunit TssG n=1 Tax=unclassified Pseudomonas TaxID=196821 RepID=UPI003CF06635